MSIIYSYPEQSQLNPNDMLIGTSTEVVGGKKKNITRNFSIKQLADFIGDGGSVFNPAASDFQIGVFNQGGTKLTGSIMSQNAFPNGTGITVGGNLTANGNLTATGDIILGNQQLTNNIKLLSETYLSGQIRDLGGALGGTDQILVSNSIGFVTWTDYRAGLVYQGTWNATTGITNPGNELLQSGIGVNGHFYIVNVAGNYQLDGNPATPESPPYWQIGDWVVFVTQGNVNTWQKIDNTSALTGTGTDNKIAMWTGGANPSVTLTDSLISQDLPATTVTVASILTTTGNINAGSSVIATANVSGVDITASGNVSAVNVTATTTVTPTTITDKDSGVGTAGQILSSTETAGVAGVGWIDNQVGTVTGTGATNALTLWSDGAAGVLGDSIVDQSAAGGVFADLYLNVKGASGGLSLDGSLQIDRSLWDGGAGGNTSAGTDGQVLTSSTQGVAPDQYQEVKWVNPTTIGDIYTFGSSTDPAVSARVRLDLDATTGSDSFVTLIGSGVAITQASDVVTFTVPAGDTYDLGSGASTIANSIEVELTSGSTTDNSAITLTGAGGLTVAQANDVVTLTAPTGSDTTYTLSTGARSGTGLVPLNLTPSSGAASVVNLAEGAGITLSPSTVSGFITISSNITQGITGSGTVNQLPKFGTTTSLTDSVVSETTTLINGLLLVDNNPGQPAGEMLIQGPSGGGGGTSTPIDLSTISSANYNRWRFSFGSTNSISKADAFRAAIGWPAAGIVTTATAIGPFTISFSNGQSIVITQPAGALANNVNNVNGSVVEIGNNSAGTANDPTYGAGSGTVTPYSSWPTLPPAGTGDYETVGSSATTEVNIGAQLDMTTHQIKNVVDPTENQDAVTKVYVDTAIGGTSQAPDVVQATTITPLPGMFWTNNNRGTANYPVVDGFNSVAGGFPETIDLSTTAWRAISPGIGFDFGSPNPENPNSGAPARTLQEVNDQADALRAAIGWPAAGITTTATDITFTLLFNGGQSIVVTQPAGALGPNTNSNYPSSPAIEAVVSVGTNSNPITWGTGSGTITSFSSEPGAPPADYDSYALPVNAVSAVYIEAPLLLQNNRISSVADPIQDQDAATRNYVDNIDTGVTSVATADSDLITIAGTGSGPYTGAVTATANTAAVTAAGANLATGAQIQTAINNSVASYLPLSGGTMTGVIDMGTDKITNVVNPTSAQDAATKGYVDTALAGSGSLIYQGGYNATTNVPDLTTSPNSILKGWTYAVTAGPSTSFWSPELNVGDLVIANIDNPTSASDWTEVQSNVGFAGSGTTDSNTIKGLAGFNSADFDVTSNGWVEAKDFTGTTPGYVPTSADPGDQAKFLKGDGSWAVPTNSGGTVTSVGLSTNVAALTATNTPVTGSGVLTLNRNGGTAGQYIDGASGAWTDLPAPGTGTVTGTGATNRVAFWNTSTALTSDANLYWDNANDRLGIGTTSPDYKLHVEDASPIIAAQSTGANNTRLLLSAENDAVYIGSTYSASNIPMYFTQAGTSGGVKRMTIAASGNIGIGTTGPDTALTVNGSIGLSYDATNSYQGIKRGAIYTETEFYNTTTGDTSKPLYNFTNNVGDSNLVILQGGNVGIGQVNPNARLKIEGNAATNGLSIKSAGNGGTYPLMVTHASGTEGDAFCIDDALNVGIGTATPAAKLDVQGGGVVPIIANSTQDYLIGLYRSGTPEWYLKAFTNGNFALHENGIGDQFTIKAGGNVGIGTDDPQNTLHLGDNTNASGGTLRIDSFVANQFWKIEPGTNTLNIKDYGGSSLQSFDGANNYVLFNGGNVGIGTASPNAKLHAVGTATNTKAVIEAQSTYASNSFFNAFRAKPANGDNSAGSGLWLGAINQTSSRISTGASYYSAGQWYTQASYSIMETTNGDFKIFTGAGATAGLNTPTERMRITSAGGISFGSTGTAYGTSGQVLTSNGNASPTWEPAASGLPTKTVANTTGSNNPTVNLGVTLASTNTAYVDLYVDGVYQNKNTFTVTTGGILTLNSSATFPAGVSIETVTTT